MSLNVNSTPSYEDVMAPVLSFLDRLTEESNSLTDKIKAFCRLETLDSDQQLAMLECINKLNQVQSLQLKAIDFRLDAINSGNRNSITAEQVSEFLASCEQPDLVAEA